MSEELSGEIERLWAKVSVPASAEPAPAAFDLSSAAWETLALLKKRQAREARRWGELLEAKEKALEASAARQKAMEEELTLLRAQAGRAEERALEEAAQVEVRLAQALKALAEERAERRAEQAAFAEALEALRARGAGDAERVKELEAERARLEALAAAREAELLRASASLKEATRALEQALSELVRARAAR